MKLNDEETFELIDSLIKQKKFTSKTRKKIKCEMVHDGILFFWVTFTTIVRIKHSATCLRIYEP